MRKIRFGLRSREKRERRRYGKSIMQVAAPDAPFFSFRLVLVRAVSLREALADSYAFTAWYRLKRREQEVSISSSPDGRRSKILKIVF